MNRRDWLLVLGGVGVGFGVNAVFGNISLPMASDDGDVAPIANLSLDVGYAQSMLLHHQQAVVLAGLASSGTGPKVAALANQIIQAQTREMARLQGWLAALDQPALPVDGDLMGWMKRADAKLNMNERLYLARCAASPAGMEGLLSPAEIRRLQTSEVVAEKERLFLTHMIKHHQGALDMSTLPVRQASTRFIRTMAQQVVEDQAREIGVFKSLLTDRPARQ